MQRPRCSAKLPKRRGLTSPITRFVSILMRAWGCWAGTAEVRRRAAKIPGRVFRTNMMLLFQFALVAEIDGNGLVGIGVHQFAVDYLEFHDVDGRSAARATARLRRSGWLGRLSGGDDCPIDVGASAVLAAEVEPPGAVPIDDDVAVVADEDALLRLPMPIGRASGRGRV